MENPSDLPPFKEWFQAEYDSPFPATIGEPDLYERIIPRAFDAMARYMDLIRERSGV